jgi:hypothetical protein
MTLAITILLILFCVQGLAKFVVWALVPYDKRIQRIASYYAKDSRVIRRFDTITLLVIVALVVALFATHVEHLSFTTGLIVGMTTIQTFFHRFNQPLPVNRAPEPPASPIKLMSFAIQAKPVLAWREIAAMTVLLCWASYMLVVHGLIGGTG